MPNDNAKNNVPDNARNKAALTFLGVLLALGAGSYYLWASQPHDYVEARPVVASDASYTDCWRGTVRAQPEMWAAIGLERQDGGSGLAMALSCYSLPPECKQDAGWVAIDTGTVPVECSDAGAEPCTAPAPPAGYDQCSAPDQVMPLGFEWTAADEEVIPWAPGMPLFAVWTAENDDAPFRCACGATVRPQDGKCEKLVTAPTLDGGYWVEATEDDMSLKADQWRGGCKRHPCASWSESVTPTECCKSEKKAGWECGTGKCGGSVGTCAEGLECRGHKCVAPPPGPDASLPAEAAP